MLQSKEIGIQRAEVVGEIPAELFAGIKRTMPMPSADVVIKMDGGVLLGKRMNQPAKGEYFTEGGRQWKNETLPETAKRKAKTEAGIDIEITGFVGQYELLYIGGKNLPEAFPAHYSTTVFLAKTVGGNVSFRSGTSDLSDFIIARSVGEIKHPFPRQLVEDSGIFETSSAGPVKAQYRTLVCEYDDDGRLTASYATDGS